MAFGLSDELLADIRAQADAHGVDRVILFGSRARGDYREVSDIDLAVSGGNVNAFTIDLMEDAQTLLDFDIVNLDGSLQEELRQSIQREGIVIHEKV